MAISIKAWLDSRQESNIPNTSPSEPIPEPAQDADSIVNQMAILARELGASPVIITGKWVRAKFSSKPSSLIREKLKANHFIWASHKEQWIFRGVQCSSKRSMPMSYIIHKYGVKIVASDNKELVEVN